MPQSTHSSALARPRVGPRAAVAAIAALDLALVVLLLFLDRVQVQSQQELARVGLGMPLNWVTQDQSIDPPLPWHTTFMSPWENPTTIIWPTFVVNLIIVGLLVTAAWAGVQVVRKRRSTE